MTKIMPVLTKLCFLRQIFVMTKVLMRQTHLCHNKHNFVATEVLSRQHISVTTKDIFCCDKHVFVTTKLLPRQKFYLWHLPPMIAKTLFFFLYNFYHSMPVHPHQQHDTLQKGSLNLFGNCLGSIQHAWKWRKSARQGLKEMESVCNGDRVGWWCR